MAKKNDQVETPATESVPAPATAAYVPPQPRQMRVEREGADGAPSSRRFPTIRAGTCEYCGTLDPKVDAKYQYKLCPHYRGLEARCSYCPSNVDPEEVVRSEVLQVAESPDRPGTLIMWCSRYECSKKHLERFKVSA